MNTETSLFSKLKAFSQTMPAERKAPLPDWPSTLLNPQTGGTKDGILWEAFCRAFISVSGRVIEGFPALRSFLEESKVKKAYCDPFLFPLLPDEFQSSSFLWSHSLGLENIDDFEFSITRAAGLIAETGTIVLNDTLSSSRLAALAPWIHIAWISHCTPIYPDVESAILALGSDPASIWITGPSKTADIEGILIEGAHGPGVQIAFRPALDSAEFPKP